MISTNSFQNLLTRRLGPSMGLLGLAIAVIPSSAVTPSSASAQDYGCCEQAYQVQCETVMQPQTVQRMRVQLQTEMVEEQVQSFRPVLKTRYEQQEYRVAKPIVETSYREETYSVLRPVVETAYREEQVQQTRYVQETAQREERVTSYKPVTQTQMYQQQYAVQRPVTDTQYYDQTYAVQRPVTETRLQTQSYTAMRPVTTMTQQTYDAGGYVPQQTVTPGQVQYGYSYVPGTHATTGPFGLFARVRGSVAVVPQVTPPTVRTQYAYRPNLITQQVPRTTLVPQTIQQQVPVQVNRMQTEYMTQRVPVARTRMETQMMTRNIPVQTTQYVPTTEVRRIPYVVNRPVTETLTRKVPFTQTRYVSETKVRKVPVRSTRMTYETMSKTVPVQYYENESVIRKVLKPVQKKIYVPYNETVMVPRQVTHRVPVAYSDPFSTGIVSGITSAASQPYPAAGYGESIVPGSVQSLGPVGSSLPAYDGSTVRSGRVPVTQPETDETPLAAPKVFDNQPRTNLKGFDSRVIEPESMDDTPMDFRDAEELPAPSLNAPQTDDFDGIEAGYRIYWRPQFAREI